MKPNSVALPSVTLPLPPSALIVSSWLFRLNTPEVSTCTVAVSAIWLGWLSCNVSVPVPLPMIRLFWIARPPLLSRISTPSLTAVAPV